VPLAFVLKDYNPPVNRLSALIADVVLTMVFSLMLSQILAGSIEALYTRGDLDLLFSSPLEPRKTLTVRFLSLAASAYAGFALLVLPFLAPSAVFGHWNWLSVFAVLGALALTASACGLALAVGLFALIGPRRTRTVAQILAALIGAAFFLASQFRNILGGRGSEAMITQVLGIANDPKLHLPPGAAWPVRAMLGDPIPLAAIVGVGLMLFVGVSAWLSRRFATDAASAQGADLAHASTGKTAATFASGIFAVTFHKELRLLWRDAALLSQVLLRVFFLIPATFLILRNAAGHMTYLLAGGTAAMALLTGQVAGSLTWITVSAEDAPELLSAAPASMRTILWAKLAAGLAPLAVLLIGPLIALTIFAPVTGIAATLGAAGTALASGLINIWHQRPGKRTEFRSRRSGSWLVGWAQLIITGLIAASAGMLAMGNIWFASAAVVPAVLAVVFLLLMRRSETQISDALAAQA
jgi:ABC-2 type transport system permease protein